MDNPIMLLPVIIIAIILIRMILNFDREEK